MLLRMACNLLHLPPPFLRIVFALSCLFLCLGLSASLILFLFFIFKCTALVTWGSALPPSLILRAALPSGLSPLGAIVETVSHVNRASWFKALGISPPFHLRSKFFQGLNSPDRGQVRDTQRFLQVAASLQREGASREADGNRFGDQPVLYGPDAVVFRFLSAD